MSKINEVKEAFLSNIESKCLEAAKEGKSSLYVGLLSVSAIEDLRKKGYGIGYKYEGVNYGGETSELVGHYLMW